MEDIITVSIVFGTGALIAISFSPLGKALADRLRHGKVPLPAPDPDPAIYEELDHMRADLSELQERVDFAERMLAKPAEEGKES